MAWPGQELQLSLQGQGAEYSGGDRWWLHVVEKGLGGGGKARGKEKLEGRRG